MKSAMGLVMGTAAAATLAVLIGILLSGSHQASGHVAQLAKCAKPQRASCGRLLVGQRYVDGVVLTEGSVTKLRLTDARGGAITLHRPSGGKALAHSSLPAGHYTLQATLRPCDANCSHLDPPIRCTAAPLKIVARQTTTATVVVGRNARCRIMAPAPLAHLQRRGYALSLSRFVARRQIPCSRSGLAMRSQASGSPQRPARRLASADSPLAYR